jgi:AraC-like DNA-binding protein
MASAANVLPNSAIGLACPGAPVRTIRVIDSELIDAIREHVRARAVRDGQVTAAWPDLYYFRADRPIGPKPVETPGVVVAVIADRAKTIELSSGQTLRYTPGSYLFVTRETRYTSLIEEATPERPYLSFAVGIDPDTVMETLLAIDDYADDGASGDDDAAWTGTIDHGLGEAFLRLLRSIDDPLERRVVTPLIVREIVFRLLRSDQAGPLRRAARMDDPRIREAMHYVRRHLATRLTVDVLAKRVAMSPSHFAHRFREVARMTPMRFVKNARLREARVRMIRDGLGAAEAAGEVGYASASHFARDFKACFGAPPAAYARELRERLAG